MESKQDRPLFAVANLWMFLLVLLITAIIRFSDFKGTEFHKDPVTGKTIYTSYSYWGFSKKQYVCVAKEGVVKAISGDGEEIFLIGVEL
jgi:hypothetical protein